MWPARVTEVAGPGVRPLGLGDWDLRLRARQAHQGSLTLSCGLCVRRLWSVLTVCLHLAPSHDLAVAVLRAAPSHQP